jgi:hypothetical protein
MYHPKKSRLAPAGFVLSKKGCQFSGFNDRCPDFPYDFAEMRHRSSLRAAYMPMGDFARAIDSRAYDRPAAHIERLGQLRLSSLTLATTAATTRSSGVSPLVSPVGEPQTSNSKADYYSLITQAVSELTTKDGEARQALYARVRAALLEQLRGRSESEIMREQRALVAAIHRVEDKFEDE